MAPKKTKSNEKLNSISTNPNNDNAAETRNASTFSSAPKQPNAEAGNVSGQLRDLLPRSPRDNLIFELSTVTRTWKRIVQLVISVIVLIIAGKAEYQALCSKLNLTGIPAFVFITNIIGIFCLSFDLGLYYFPFLNKSWNTQKVVLFELLSDFSITTLQTALFAVSVISVPCPVGSAPCDQYNTISAFTFFNMIAWFVSLFLDGKAWVQIRRARVFLPR